VCGGLGSCSLLVVWNLTKDFAGMDFARSTLSFAIVGTDERATWPTCSSRTAMMSSSEEYDSSSDDSILVVRDDDEVEFDAEFEDGIDDESRLIG